MKKPCINWRPHGQWQWFAVLWCSGIALAFGLSLAAKLFIAFLKILFRMSV